MTEEVKPREPEKLPPGVAEYIAKTDFITPWGPRYVAGQTVRLTKEQYEDLENKGVLEEPGVKPKPYQTKET